MAERDGREHTLTTVRHDRAELPSLMVRATTSTGERRETPLAFEPVRVGSSPEAELCVDDKGVSRFHCSLSLTERGVELTDLGSKNGTRIGGVDVERARVRPGVPIGVGATTVEVALVGPATLVEVQGVPSFGEAIGASLVMRRLFALLTKAAASQETILLQGESGTGKELLAHGVHVASARKHGPYVVVDCGGIAPSLIEAELFGYVRGAFTGADTDREGLLSTASGGTLFIDEVGELPLDLQPKLLRAIEAREIRAVGSNQPRPIDVRMVAATHRDLSALVREGAFREDLYYRLAVLPLRVPALRERREDIPLLVERFLLQLTPPRSLDDLPPSAQAMLENHHWPGNVRELRNAVARMSVFPEIDAELVLGGAPSARDGAALDGYLRLPLREAREAVVEAFEVRYLQARLRESGGNVSRTADAIGISRQLLHRLLAKHGIARDP